IADGEGDIAIVGPVDLFGTERLEELDGLLDTSTELGEARLLVLERRDGNTREAGAAALDQIARDLDLAGGHENVGEEPRGEQGARLDPPGLDVRPCLAQDRREAGEHLDEDGDRYLVHGNSHGHLLWAIQMR